MKYRVMDFTGTIEDFEKESDAWVLFEEKKLMVSKAEVEIINETEVIPSANIHKCYHDEYPLSPCEIIEKVEAEISSVRSAL